ncbi:MAG: DUF2783 domain-containing protein [Rhodobacteraceae bacterium]|nr:DUF2783 domain-containing protein [Paracoccaceae bacterium]
MTNAPLGARSDDVYQALMDAHTDRSDAESAALNARLVLMLANEVGNADRVISVIAEAATMDE